MRWAIVIEMISVDVAREQYGQDAVQTASSHGTQNQALIYMNTLHSLTNGYFALSGNDNIGSTTTTDLGKQLQAAFAESGLSRFALSRRAGVSYAIVHRYFGGERDIKFTTASKLANALNLELRRVQKRK